MAYYRRSEMRPWLDVEIPIVLLLVLSYLAFVLRIGPAIMKNRPAFKLTTTILVYNAVQVLISVFLVKVCLSEVMETGLLPRKCYLSDEDYFNLAYFGNRLYFYAKITELLDTVFFVLRKKNNQVSVLHVTHHAGMVLIHLVFKHHPSHITSMIRMVNSGIHVIMYSYYSLAALGPSVAKYLTWKKYITSLQLVQFIFFIAYSIATDLVSECALSKGHAFVVLIYLLFILILFGNFYYQNYVDKQPKGISTVKNFNPCMVQTAIKKTE